MTRLTNTNTETYRNVDIDTTYFSDGSHEITIDGEDILEFDSVDQAKAYIDNEYLKYPYISLAIDMYNYERSYLWDDPGLNIFDYAKDLNDPLVTMSSVDYFKEQIELWTDDNDKYVQECNDILKKLIPLDMHNHIESYGWNRELVAAFIGIKTLSDFEPTKEGLIDIWEYLENVAFLLSDDYMDVIGHIPTFDDFQEAWEEMADEGYDPHMIFYSLFETTLEIDF